MSNQMSMDEIIEDSLRRVGFLDLIALCCGARPLPPRKGDHQMAPEGDAEEANLSDCESQRQKGPLS